MTKKLLSETSLIKTLRFNFKYFPFKTAVKFPVFVSKHVRFRYLGGTVTIKNPSTGCIRLGYDRVSVFDNKKSRSLWQVKGKVEFDGEASLGHGFKLDVNDKGVISFGDKFCLVAESSIICYKRISFGEDCLLSWDVLIMDTDLHKIFNSENEQTNQNKDIVLGNHTWIGCRSTILKGSYIPNGTIIAAQSLVHNNLKCENCIYGGSPLSLLKKDIYWDH